MRTVLCTRIRAPAAHVLQAAATAATLPLALPEARAAWRELRG